MLLNLKRSVLELWMFKTLLLSVLLLLSACSQKVVHPGEKAFAEEDSYILFALHFEQEGNYERAGRFFYTLYEKSLKKEYLYRSLRDMMVAQNYTKVLQMIEEEDVDTFADVEITRIKVKALLALKREKEARELAVALAKHTQDPQDYLLVSDVYTQSKNYNLALKYLEGAYIKEYNEAILDKIAVILYANLGKKREAIAELESHIRIHGCSEILCKRLISFYSHENNVDGLLSVYKRAYAKYKSEDVANKIIQLYLYKRSYVELIDFLKQNHLNKKLLLQLYVSGKRYKEASKLAMQLYKERGDVAYLGESAIYKYEAYGKKISKKELQNVVANLKNVIKKSKKPLYMNYLGYILIDHNINVKEGIRYIKTVLQKEPNSAYYLDSLAWGYYRLGMCRKAYAIMKRVVKMEGGSEPEVQEHMQAIKTCLKQKKKVKKR